MLPAMPDHDAVGQPIATLESLDLRYPKVDSSKLKELDRMRDVLLAEAV